MKSWLNAGRTYGNIKAVSITSTKRILDLQKPISDAWEALSEAAPGSTSDTLPSGTRKLRSAGPRFPAALLPLGIYDLQPPLDARAATGRSHIPDVYVRRCRRCRFVSVVQCRVCVVCVSQLRACQWAC